MSLIQCSCNCAYQREGYCGLDKAAEVTSSDKKDGCLYFIPEKKDQKKNNANKILSLLLL